MLDALGRVMAASASFTAIYRKIINTNAGNIIFFRLAAGNDVRDFGSCPIPDRAAIHY